MGPAFININPQCMCEGYSICSVSEQVCVSNTTPATTYLVYTLKIRCHYAFYGVLKIWILLKTLYSEVLATFADHHGLLWSLMSSWSIKDTAIISLQEYYVCIHNGYENLSCYWRSLPSFDLSTLTAVVCYFLPYGLNQKWCFCLPLNVCEICYGILVSSC